jgi:Spy/CpxP family protein refolding chaperone
MNGKKTGFAVLMGVFLAASMFAAINALADGPGMGHAKFGRHPIFGLMHKLDLTDAQKTIVAGVLKQNETAAKTNAANLAAARAQLAKDILSGNQGQIGADCASVSSAQAAVTLLVANMSTQMLSQLGPTLSADQQATLQKIQSKIGTNIDAAIDARFARLDKWIARHSQ